MTTRDLDDLIALHAEPDVARFTSSFDREQAIELLQADQREWSERGHGLLAVTERSSGRFLGRTGLKFWPQFDETEVGWVLRPQVWGRGFATEAAQACIGWGFAHLESAYFTAMIRPENDRSIKVAERLHMTPSRHDRLFEVPVVVYVSHRP
jgi:RimJ/RimL family protein N-acetyltransferase